MSEHKHLPSGVLKSAFAVAEKIEPLKTKKDPVIAAISGFALGGLGLGLYLKSWVDFFIPFFMLLILMVVGLPLGELPLFFCAHFLGGLGIPACEGI